MLMPPSIGTAALQTDWGSQSALAPTLLASRATSPNVEPAKPAEREEAEIESESSDSQQEQGRNDTSLI